MFLAAVRLLPAFLLAACGRSSFTAFAQEHAGLGSLLHGAQGLSPHAQTARRLQLAAMATQCLGKCKGLGALYVDMLPYMSTPEPGASLGLGDLLGSGMQSMLGGSMGAVFGTVCAHSATLSCMRTECVPPDGGLSRGIETALSEAPCLCEACPQFMTAVADMQSLSASLGNVSQVGGLPEPGELSSAPHVGQGMIFHCLPERSSRAWGLV